ncbi:MAG: histidine kinase, partial [Vicinamibacterales bacterium]
PLAAGVVARQLLNYKAADLTLEGAFLAGLVAGPYAGAIVGIMAGLPPLVGREWIAPLFTIGAGFAGGGIRELCPKEAIWHFSPFVFTRLPLRAWQMLKNRSIDWQIVLLMAPIGLELLRQIIGLRWGATQQRLFFLGPEPFWTLAVILLATVLAVATPIKIWNNARIEHRLEEQEKLLMAAKVQALANQINPHFLFNTLTSISSLIRTKPDTARMLITKLSALLRRLMRSTDQFITLREELSAIDEYLDIEVVRFGPQLRVEKQIGPDTLDLIVPSMLLQPLVENSIKHGLTRKVGGGRITIRSEKKNGRAIIEVRDDGLGMTPERLESAFGDGIGLSNVNERLQTIYGATCRLKVISAPGKGTSVTVEIPETSVPERVIA